jgi:SAM-dependent methyltransferase
MNSAPSPPDQTNAWEAAYQRFETPEEEIRKFIRRLRKFGADSWNRDALVVELFCGRGNGLHALHRLGFQQVEGIDLSSTLAARYQGAGRVHVGDCRNLPFPDASRDIAIVQGGLHHLPSLADLDLTLTQVNRVLRPGGFFLAVEPWLTPFLRLVHAACRIHLVRRRSGRLDALATMIEHERVTYEQWLGHPQTILDILQKHFRTERLVTGWGKLAFVGRNG